LCSTGICAPPILFYTYQLQRVIASIKTSRSFYDEVEAKVKRNFRSFLSMTIVGSLFGVCMIVIPAFHNNMYIVYNIIIISGLASTMQILHLTSGEGIKVPETPRQIIDKDTLVEMTISQSSNPRSGDSSIDSTPLQVLTRPTALSSTQEIEPMELNPSTYSQHNNNNNEQNPDSSAHPLFNPFLATEDNSNNNIPPARESPNSETTKPRDICVEISNQGDNIMIAIN